MLRVGKSRSAPDRSARYIRGAELSAKFIVIAVRHLEEIIVTIIANLVRCLC